MGERGGGEEGPLKLSWDPGLPPHARSPTPTSPHLGLPSPPHLRGLNHPFGVQRSNGGPERGGTGPARHTSFTAGFSLTSVPGPTLHSPSSEPLPSGPKASLAPAPGGNGRSGYPEALAWSRQGFPVCGQSLTRLSRAKGSPRTMQRWWLMADPLPRAGCEWGGEGPGEPQGHKSRSQGQERPSMFLAGQHPGVQDCELTRLTLAWCGLLMCSVVQGQVRSLPEPNTPAFSPRQDTHCVTAGPQQVP